VLKVERRNGQCSFLTQASDGRGRDDDAITETCQTPPILHTRRRGIPSVAGRRCCSASQLGMSPLPRLSGIEVPNKVRDRIFWEMADGRRDEVNGLGVM